MSFLRNAVTAAIISISSFSAMAENKVISTENIEWGLLNPARGDASPKAFDLWGDRTKDMATGMLVKFEKGFSSPPHIHNISYRGVVIEGLMHNDDPTAAKMWLPSGSFWTQPAGEDHITAANAQDNLIYLEIDSGPYLVQHSDHAFDNGERPINLDSRNLVWLSADDAKWIDDGKAQIVYLWGETDKNHGSFVKLPKGFDGYIKSDSDLKAVVVKGKATYTFNKDKSETVITPSSFFSSSEKGKHNLKASEETVLYINANRKFSIED